MPHNTKGSVPLKEHTNYAGGKSGSKVPIKSGPAVGGAGKYRNPVKGGGINRATKG